ncbi:MAG: hypothetical protein WB994_23420 [Candidatus Acidiferrum sp.]
MNARLGEGNILRTGKKILGFVGHAGLVGLALACAGPAVAQSKPVQAESTALTLPGAASPQTSSGVGSSSATPAAKQAVAQNSPAKQSASKGQHEGIKVHGHWTIEVKNPDGTVVTHREFENSIQPTGAAYLAALLSGNNSSGGLSITLNGAQTTYGNVDSLIQFSEPGPCLPISSAVFNSGGPSSGTTCLITSANSILGYQCAATVSIPTCSTNITATAPTFTASTSTVTGQLVLKGQVTASSTVKGSVTDVETLFITCDTNSVTGSCVNYYNPQTGQSPTNANIIAANLFTERNLDGPANGDPAAVPYMPLQVIEVTVTFSFQ